jgi:hypothetical protein
MKEAGCLNCCGLIDPGGEVDGACSERMMAWQLSFVFQLGVFLWMLLLLVS